MGNFFAELRRRHIYRIGGLYVVVAWGITQVIDVLSQIYALPDWIAQPILAVLVLGFPVTLLFAWTIIGAAKAADTPAELRKATITDWVLAIALIVVIGLIGYQNLTTSSADFASTTEQDNSTVYVADEIIEDVAARLPNSIAVLPLDNLSPDPERAYFAAGIHEEILNKLSRLQNIAVIARNSVVQYEDSDKTIPKIADELNVEMVMRGSVRYADDQVRVTAQLIDGETDLPVWVYEDGGDLADIFGIQAEIAMNIANSLQADYSISEQEGIEEAPTDSPEAYDLYLRVLEIIREGIFGGNPQMEARRTVAQGYLDTALELDPEFATAHALKAYMYMTARFFDATSEADWLDFRSEMDQLAESELSMALELDPDLGIAHAFLSQLHFLNLRGEEAQLAAEQALRLSPNDPSVLQQYARMEVDIRGRRDEAVRYLERAIELDPNSRALHQVLAHNLTAAGRNAEAREAAERCFELAVGRGAGCLRPLAIAEFRLGNDQAALNTLRRADGGQGYATYAEIAWGYGLLGQSDDAQRAFERVEEMATAQYVDPSIRAWAYMGIGNYTEALRLMNLVAENPELLQYDGSWAVKDNIWSDPVLEQPEWVDLRSRLGFRQ